MKTIESKFISKGFDFELIKREGRVALFRKTRGVWSGFEVVILQHAKEQTWPDGRVTPAHEALPGSEQFGRLGWACGDMRHAEKRFSEALAMVRSGPEA